jgi:hypothetical protein
VSSRLRVRSDRVAGGTAKFPPPAASQPPATSTCVPGLDVFAPDLEALLLFARRRRLKVVLNQDGVAYPGWAGEETAELNRRYGRALHAADHVLFQSRFSKESSDLFLGEPDGEWEILYNAVDVDRFTPPANVPPGGPVLLLAGDQTQAYRLELAVRTFARVRGVARGPPARHTAGSSRRWNRCSARARRARRVESQANTRSVTRP